MENTEEKKMKIVKTQKYTFVIEHNEDGTTNMIRHNEGFSVLELLGMCSLVSNHLCKLVEKPIETENITYNSKPTKITNLE